MWANLLVGTSLTAAFLIGAASSALAQSTQKALLPDALSMTPYQFQAMLDWRRPKPVLREEVRQIAESLPEEGRVRILSAAERRKLSSVDQILRLHHRESVYTLVVIAVPQAYLGLYDRAILLISQNALQVLNAEELGAVVAHEVGHEYAWEEYRVTRDHKDFASLRDVEIWCDAVAILTLRRVGLPPSRLSSGLQKLSRFNRQRLGRALNEDAYPEFQERSHRLDLLVDWAKEVRPDQRRARVTMH